jgi:hypothetical protein
MTTKLEEAKREVDETYDLLVDAVRNVTASYTAELDGIVKELSKGINLFSNTELWDFQVRLSIAAYVLGNAKEQSSLKEACAEALYKESLARTFNSSVGTQEAKKQTSILESVDKQTISILYASAASLLKTKCDEAHRLVNVLQGIQISRAAEAKISASPRSESDRQVLLEDIR